MSILAVDAGAAGVTALVVTADGTVAARSRQGLSPHFPEPGRVEHAPEEIWQATLAAVRDCLAAWDGSKADLDAVGITNQRETVLLWDRETLGSPRRAIGSQDRRTSDICGRLRDEGHEHRLTELTGLRLDPCFSATALVWLAEHEPRTWALVEDGRYAIGTVDSYLVARMTRGTWHLTDVSNASRTLLLDLEHGSWSQELCDLFGVPVDALPEIVPSWGRVATTDPSAFLGASRCTLGIGASILVNTGAELLRSDAGLLSTAAWRSPTGELTHALEGSLPDTAESTPFALRDLGGAMPVPLTSLAVDGETVDDRLCQLLADLLGVRVRRPEIGEAPALGAAFLAGLGTGVWRSVDHLREIRAPDREFVPGERPS
jgi:glycerol kinase